MKISESASQPRRLLYLVIYIVIFMAISFHLFGSILPALSEQGFWFYTGLASLVIGSLLVTPFYTNPANGLSYATAGLVAILYTKPLNISLGFQLTLIIFAIVIAFSLLGIATIKSKSNLLQKFSYSSRILVENFGNPRILYLVLLIYAILQFHSNSFKESFWIFIAGLIVVIQVIELIDSTLVKIWNHWKLKKDLTHIGTIEAYQSPNILLIRLEEGIQVDKESALIIKDPIFGLKLGFNLGYMGRDENILLRVLELKDDTLSKSKEKFYSNLIPDSQALVVGKELRSKLAETSEILKKADSFIGIVDTESTVGNISIELINERGISEGSLLELKINGEDVLYQVLDGITWEDIVAQKNKYAYSKAKARKIGKWNDDKKKFENIKWMPSINSPVFLKTKDILDVPPESIGTFPDTNYFVSIKDINHLVTHNTAILGILGVGKSFLSIELTERMISQNIKVIVIDLTNQYENELKGFYKPEMIEQQLNDINAACKNGKDNIQKKKEDGGSIKVFKDEIKKQLEKFINRRDLVNLLIYNPLKFDVWKQAGGIYTIKGVDGNIATMENLTPCEITQIITELTLEICQKNGMTDEANVCLVFEEAHSLIPEFNSVVGENDKNAASGTARAILQGRKYGLGCLLVTQRTANVTKTILNQCNTIFALRTFDETGKSFLANYFGYDYSRILSSIPEQQAVVFGKASSCENPVLIQLNNRDNFIKKFRESNPIPEFPEWRDEQPTNKNELSENNNNETNSDDGLPF